MVENHHNLPTFIRQEMPFPGVYRPVESLLGIDRNQDTPLLSQPLQSVEIFDAKAQSEDPVVTDIKAMCGMQNLNMEHRLLFYLHYKDKNDPLNNPPLTSSIVLDSVEADVHMRPESLSVWRHLIALTLLSNAKIELMLDDEMFGTKALLAHLEKEPKIPSNRIDPILTKLYLADLRFNLQRQRSKVAKATRRGYANTLVGSRTAIEEILKELPDYFKDVLNVVIFEDNEVVHNPWVLIGYNGNNPYDAALLFGYHGTKKSGFGGLALHNIDKYWRRIV